MFTTRRQTQSFIRSQNICKSPQANGPHGGQVGYGGGYGSSQARKAQQQ
jgi:hypothetical protein